MCGWGCACAARRCADTPDAANPSTTPRARIARRSGTRRMTRMDMVESPELRGTRARNEGVWVAVARAVEDAARRLRPTANIRRGDVSACPDAARVRDCRASCSFSASIHLHLPLIPPRMPASDLPLVARALTHADRTAIVDAVGAHTYAQLADASARVAAALLAGGGDLGEARVCFLVPPSFEYAAVQWGVWRAGGIAVPLAVSHPPAELQYAIGDA